VWRYLDGLKEIVLRLSDNEYSDYVRKGQSMYSKRMRRKITDEEYARWVFLLGEYFKGQCLSEN
jgi:very-short-patch-repair endonuclease